VTFRQHNGIIATITTQFGNRSAEITASGNGRLNAVSNALKKAYGLEYDLDTYEEHALEKSSSSRAIAYVGVRSRKSGVLYWGAGVDVDIIRASVSALLTAVNNMVNAEDTALSE
ncbi:alpha-isopropylmalate synthase regulatory domain-containing protein, partial [Porcincola intestinalis]